MKLLTKLYGLNEARSVKMDLEDRGIPIHIGGENTGPGMGIIVSSDCYTIWVEIEEQLDCAAQAIDNPNYAVLNPVNVIELRNLQESHIQEFRFGFSSLNERILNVIVVCGLIFGGIYVLSSM